MPVFTALAIGAAVLGTAASVYGTVKAGQAQRAAADAQAKQQSNERQRSAIAAIRQAQLAGATARASAQGAGMANGSGYFGGIGAIGSQLGGALGYSSEQSALSGVINKQTNSASFWSGIASIGSTAATMAGNAGVGPLDIFKPKAPTPDFKGPTAGQQQI